MKIYATGSVPRENSLTSAAVYNIDRRSSMKDKASWGTKPKIQARYRG